MASFFYIKHSLGDEKCQHMKQHGLYVHGSAAASMPKNLRRLRCSHLVMG